MPSSSRLTLMPLRRAIRLAAFASAMLCVLAWSAAAQTRATVFDDAWRWRRFETSFGASSRAVVGIVESDTAETWVVTAAGVAWFDGYTWRVVPPSPALPRINTDVFDLVVDRDELFLVSSFHVFIGDRAGFRELLKDGRPVFGRELARLGGGRVLVVPAGAGCSVIEHGRAGPCAAGDAPTGPVRSARSLPGGSVWAATDAGLYERLRGVWQLRVPAAGHSWRIAHAAEARDGTAFVQVIESNGRPEHFWQFPASRSAFREVAGVRPADVVCFDVSPDGELLFVDRSGRVHVRGTGGDVVLGDVPLDVKSARAVRFRANGDVWMASEFGAYLFLYSSGLWQSWRDPDGRKPGSVNALMKAADGSIWVGRDVGVEVHRPDGTVSEWADAAGALLNAVTGIAEDTSRRVWLTSGSAFTGAYRQDGPAWVHVGREHGLADISYHRVTADRRGRLWFLGSGPAAGLAPGAAQGGVPCFVLDGSDFRRFDVPVPQPGGRIYAFAEAADGTLWFGTSGGLLSYRNGAWSSAAGLLNSRVFALTIDEDGAVWFGHQTNGLGVLRNGKVRYYTSADGLVSDSVWDVATAPGGDVWIASRSGLTRYRRGAFARIGRTAEFGGLALWPVLPVDHRVLVGTIGAGVSVLDLQAVPTEPPVVMLEYPALVPASATFRWAAHTHLADEPPESVECRYATDGAEWSAWRPEMALVVEALPPGIHRFRVQARNRYGVASTPAAVTFEIPYPWYRHPALLTTVSVLSLFGLVLAAAATARWRATQRRIATSEARLRAIVEDETDAVIRLLPDGRLTYANPAFAAMQQRSVGDLLGTDFLVDLGEHRQAMAGQIAALGSDSPPLVFDQQTTRDGRECVTSWVVRGIFDRAGVLSELQAVGHDVTAIKQAADQRKTEEARLVASQKFESLGRLSGGLAHRFNNLLTTILGRASLIGMADDIDPEVRGSLDEIKRAADDAASLSRLMLMYTGRGPRHADAVNLSALIREMQPLFDVTLSSSCTFDIRTADPIPQVRLDPSQARQLMLTLVTNSSEALPPGGGSIVVSSGVAQCSRLDLDACDLGKDLPAGRYAYVEVVDTGSGMTPEVRSQMFDPFFTTKFVGRGRGLAAAQGIVRSHRGAIRVQTAPGAGTSIRVLFPVIGDDSVVH